MGGRNWQPEKNIHRKQAMKKRWGLKTLKVEEKQLRVITYSA
jgi:hypothetical protein